MFKKYMGQLQKVRYNFRWDNPEIEARAYRAGIINKILSPIAAKIYEAWTGKWPDDFEAPPKAYKGRAYERPQ